MNKISGCKFPSALTTQLPVYDGQPRFKKKLSAGRPSKKKKPTYWVR